MRFARFVINDGGKSFFATAEDMAAANNLRVFMSNYRIDGSFRRGAAYALSMFEKWNAMSSSEIAEVWVEEIVVGMEAIIDYIIELHNQPCMFSEDGDE
jgi:hypothetical protein